MPDKIVDGWGFDGNFFYEWIRGRWVRVDVMYVPSLVYLDLVRRADDQS